MSMLSEGSEAGLTRAWNKVVPELSHDLVDQLAPKQPAFIPLSQCVADPIVLDSGLKAEDQEFFYTVEFDFATRADQAELLKHPQIREIADTMEAFMRADPDVTESFQLELDRDYSPVYIEGGEVGRDTLTSGTRSDLQFSVNEMVNIINATYGTNIQGASVAVASEQLYGCGEPSFEDSKEPVLASAEKGDPVVARTVSLPAAGM